jgi:hypothetical protein
MLLAASAVGLSNRQKLLDSFAVEDVKTALQQARTPEQIGKALEQNPSNPLLQLIAKATNAALETERLTNQISNEIEPPSLTKGIDLAHAGRADLEAYRRDLKAAEANTAAAAPRYVALLDEERKKIETFAQSLRVAESTTRALLSGVDKRHAGSKDFTLRMLTARAELYRALGKTVAILLEQFGQYKVDASGRFLFSSQSIADRYNAISAELSDATKRVAELDEERQKLVQVQQEGWQRFISGK